jgi:hypothetical protein
MRPVTFQVLLQGLATLIVVALALTVYDHWIAGPNLRIGVVDLNAVYREKESEFTRRVTEAHTDAERDQAMQAARTFAQRLPLALEALSDECQCLVLLSSAVVTPATPDVPDLTPQLRRKSAPP